ncbi:MAG: hypothetical protein L6420_00145 [Elusimicrobia bacterium]|nr:hypothetical protein [Elusimicrobiota bacterium]
MKKIIVMVSIIALAGANISFASGIEKLKGDSDLKQINSESITQELLKTKTIMPEPKASTKSDNLENKMSKARTYKNLTCYMYTNALSGHGENTASVRKTLSEDAEIVFKVGKGPFKYSNLYSKSADGTDELHAMITVKKFTITLELYNHINHAIYAKWIGDLEPFTDGTIVIPFLKDLANGTRTEEAFLNCVAKKL